jgi:hypothetical protein
MAGERLRWEGGVMTFEHAVLLAFAITLLFTGGASVLFASEIRVSYIVAQSY